MIRDDPEVDPAIIAAALEAHYGLSVASVAFLPIGYDLSAAVYEVTSRDGDSYFLKVRREPVSETGLQVARALVDHGVPHVMTPIPTRSARLWAPVDDLGGLILYPFVRGDSAMAIGLSEDQWREFGATLRAIHDSGLETTFSSQLRGEDFQLPSAALVRHVLALTDRERFASPAAARFAEFWQANAGRIESMLARAEELGRALCSRPLPRVLCHGDIHAANILVGEDRQIHLVDWDAPLIAPRERDLLFVIGANIARRVEPEEEDWFFTGYGPIAIDPEALIYFRYERIIEDLGEIGKSVFIAEQRSEAMRSAEAELAMSFFAPGADIDRAEHVAPRWRQGATAGT